MPNSPCPVCDEALNLVRPTGGDRTYFDCPACGRYELTGNALVCLPDMRRRDPRVDRVLSFAIRRRQLGENGAVRLDIEAIESLVANTPVPNVAEQAENLILWLGQNSPSVGEPHNLHALRYRSVIGSGSISEFTLVGEHLLSDGTLFRGGVHHDGFTGALSFKGWQRYEELQRGATKSHRILMAMPFGPDDVRRAFESFKPAVKQAGFELYNLREDHTPGLIDDKLRVAIRTSRFLVADLTHGNQGAYWEAGFAEGLRKPVIYTCEKGYFETKRVHFDTGHLHHVLWTLDDLGGAADRLKASIRATPGLDAKMEDGE